ncbi:uncharacterized protein APUU_21232A [Aspergillus puulaauensis]|uniref:Uncharacterized protein n=1 Tax=Aspergillus puulaauensis TaxID=1220207 RepID=A0A7R8AKK2_9EURO|nr:uncharacterized protein APUU_21232A [Aspergillus puulaauensis]BCS20800.1 hypothetical protein APUU_21232A [Aspergillus puulaauensis]
MDRLQTVEEPLEVVVTYALKYGERAGRDLNLVVLRKGTPGLEAESEEVLAAMTAVYRARKAAWDVADLYGLHTESYDWRFFHVNDSGQYSRLSLSWDTDRQKIVGLLWKIMDQAIILAQPGRGVNGTMQ